MDPSGAADSTSDEGEIYRKRFSHFMSGRWIDYMLVIMHHENWRWLMVFEEYSKKNSGKIKITKTVERVNILSTKIQFISYQCIVCYVTLISILAYIV
jgi:hypothetical protein